MAISLDNVSDGDMKRFAACWLNSEMQCDWEGATATYAPNGDIKVASFKTVTGKAGKKVIAESGGEVKATPKKAVGGKRKKATSEEGADGEAVTKKKKGKATKKNSKSEETVNEGEETPVKGEEATDED